jgi:hypothetical protein
LLLAFPTLKIAILIVGWLRRLAGGDVLSDLLVNPDGRVELCQVLYSKAPRRNVDRFCEVAVGLKSGNPAIGPDGKPAYGLATLDLYARLVASPRKPEPSRPADLDVIVASLPVRFGNKLRIVADVFVSETGEVQECGPSYDQPANLVEGACQQVRQHSRPVMHSRANEPVAYVADVLVDFATEPVNR